MKQIEASAHGLAFVLSVASVACDASVSGVTEDGDVPVAISTASGTLAIEAPPGGYNSFSLDVSCSYEEASGSYGVWTRAGYSIDRNVDCLDCLLPETIVIGELVADHVITACLPSDEHESCEPSSAVEGLKLADLLKPATMENGDLAPVTSMHVMFLRVHELYDPALEKAYGVSVPYPRIDTASALLGLDSDGRISVDPSWSFCDDALNSDLCFE